MIFVDLCRGAYDSVYDFRPGPRLDVDLYIEPLVRLASGYGGQVDESWGLGGLYRRWDETVPRLTYQF